MFGRVAYRLAKYLAMSLLAVVAIAVLMDGLAWLAIEGDGPRISHENAPGAAPQSTLLSDVSTTGRSAAVGPDGAVVFSEEHGAASIRGHDSPLVTARLIRNGRSLVTIDASGHARLSDVDAAWQIQRLPDGGSLGRVAGKIWKAFGSPLARLSLAALAHVRELSFRDCEDCPEMVVVPAGHFVMGSPENEAEREELEGPQHEVTLAAPFAVGRYHVTRDQYARFVAATGYQGGSACLSKSEDGKGDWVNREGRGWRFAGFAQTGDHPAVCISWDDAQAFAAWLSSKTGRAYRLLTEAELEYVTRAGTTTPFWWGSSITPDQANYDGNYVYEGGGSKGEYREKTLPVKSFKPNPWGLYQVHGNVWSWVEDCWHNDYSGAPLDGSPWITKQCDRRVLRGGSWDNVPRSLRAARRDFDRPGGRFDYVGFRLARTLDPVP
jgi:formylglycine-generating enzyme required for sulfatase activity